MPEEKLAAVTDYTLVVMTPAVAAAAAAALAVAVADTGSVAVAGLRGSVVAEGLVVGVEEVDIVVAAVAAAAADTGIGEEGS